MEVGFKFNKPDKPEPVRIEQVFAEVPGGGMIANPAYDAPPTTPVGLKDGQYTLIKEYRLVSSVAAADTTIKIEKGSGVAVGDIIATGGKGVACTEVDETNADYDTVTVTLGVAIAEGTMLYQAKEASDDAAVPIITPKFVTGGWVYADEGDQPVRLLTGANLRKETANISNELADIMPTITLV